MNVNSHTILILAVIFLCIGVDQATKWLAQKHLAPHGFISFAADTFRLQYAENTGAFLSLGSSLPEPWRHLIFTVLVGIFLLALLAFLFFNRALPQELSVCLALVCAGGLSNLIDRVAYGGRVVDFLNVGIGPLRTGIFNVADMAITGGAIFLLIDNFRRKPENQQSAGR
jgi:signal peptidase II